MAGGRAPPERRGELIGSALAAAIVGVLLGPVIGGAATVVGPEIVFSSAALLAAGLAGWALATPGVEPEGGPLMRPMLEALGRPSVLGGFWLFCLPAIFAGTVEVLAPLRLDELGASGVAVGAIFLLMGAVEAAVSPLAGRLSDRRGRLVPLRAGLGGSVLAAVLLPLPETAVLLTLVLIAAVVAMGTMWAPGMALISDASESAGLQQGMAFGLSNLAWAGGHLIGGAGAGALADATSDALSYGLVGALCALTLAGLVTTLRQAQEGQGAVPRAR